MNGLLDARPAGIAPVSQGLEATVDDIPVETPAARAERHRELAKLDGCLAVLEEAQAGGARVLDEQLVRALASYLPFLAPGMSIKDAHMKSLRYESRYLVHLPA